jgi:VirE N-terminal domain./Primase C terminal 2 (PriCT-2).
MLWNEQIVSFFNDAMDTRPVNFPLMSFLNNGSNWAAFIKKIRAEESKEAKSSLKKQLPAATISGRFERRRAAAEISHYNGLICLDFDEGDGNPPPEQMKGDLSQFSQVAYASLSVGGRGVFAIIPTNNEKVADHPRICDFLRDIFLQIGLKADPSCKDVSRLRFQSYDPSPYIAHAPNTFDAVSYLEKIKSKEQAALRAASTKPAGDVGAKVEDYVRALESGCNDPTHNYHDWIRLGFALASEFGSAGENYFHRVSKFHPKYDYYKTSKKYNELLKNGSNRIGIGTFFKILQDNGIKL